MVEAKVIDEIFSITDASIRNHYDSKEFVERIKNKFSGISSTSMELFQRVYEALLDLEFRGINRIWARVIKNSFAPFFSGKFDFVIGNPPWVNWENLPADYRKETKPLWLEYGLIRKSSAGRFKKDLAMLFTVVSNSRYLSDQGYLGFLVPFPLIKTQAGSGYRSFLASKCEIIKFDEMVGLAPFENVINRTSLLVLKKGQTDFPVDCTSWSKVQEGELRYDYTINQIIRITRRRKMVLEPIKTKTNPESPWITIDRSLLKSYRKVCGLSDYKAYSGVDTGLNGVFWIEMVSKTPVGILVKNCFDVGKSELEMVQTVVEEENIFPLIRGRDVKKWRSEPSGYILLPHNKLDGRPVSESQIKTQFPKTYSYFTKFKPKLENRSTHKLMGTESPFYAAYKIGKYTFAPYKVAWKEISGKISGKGQFIVAAVKPSSLDKKIMPTILDHKLIFIPLENKEEAFSCVVCSAVLLCGA